MNLAEVLDNYEPDTDFYVVMAPNKQMKLRIDASVPDEHLGDAIEALQGLIENLKQHHKDALQ